MVYFLTFLHVVVCLFLVIVVLLQSGKAADLAGAFGGMGSQTAFGPRGTATLLSKWTTIAAALFMVTSLSLALVQTRTSGGASSVVDRVKPVAPPKPAGAATPGAPNAAPVPGSGGSGVKIQMPQVTPSVQQGAPSAAPVPPGGKK
jgi:preprotein translocase subunit SecG